jgi:hypothetical protein
LTDVDAFNRACALRIDRARGVLPGDAWEICHQLEAYILAWQVMNAWSRQLHVLAQIKNQEIAGRVFGCGDNPIESKA